MRATARKFDRSLFSLRDVAFIVKLKCLSDIWEVPAGCRVEFKCWQLDVALLQCLLCQTSAVDVSCRLRWTFGPTRTLCQVTSANLVNTDKKISLLHGWHVPWKTLRTCQFVENSFEIIFFTKKPWLFMLVITAPLVGFKHSESLNIVKWCSKVLKISLN